MAASLFSGCGMKASPESQCQKQKRCRLIIHPPAAGCTQGEHRTSTAHWPTDTHSWVLRASCHPTDVGSRRQRNQTEICELHNSSVDKCTWKGSMSIQHGLGWEQLGTAWHPSTAIARALLTSTICFFLSLSHEKVSWGRKRLIGRLLPSLAKVKIQVGHGFSRQAPIYRTTTNISASWEEHLFGRPNCFR